MGGVVPVSKFDKAFRVVPVNELGVPLKGRRITAEDEAQRKDWALQQVMLLIANKSLGREDCGVIDQRVVSTTLIRPYLIAAAESQGVALKFRNASLVHKRTLAMRGTSGRITLVSLI
tara:strand:+ start:30 stop:383 length:354 start_codon:yes stop_codon:yes gene_type:complete